MQDRTLASSGRNLVVVWLAATLCIGIFATAAAAKPAPVTKIRFHLADHNVPPGSAVTSTVLVRTRSGHAWVPFAGAPLSVRVDGTQVLTVTTGANGEAPISYVAATGDHVMKVVFAGDATHKRAQRAQGFSVVAGATAVPSAPTLSASVGTAVVHLSWTTPFDGGSAITGYDVYKATTSGGETLLATLPVTSFYDDFAVTSGLTYYYEVSAINANGEGARSVEIAATPV
jgi:predicted phage tail protein